MGADTKVNTRGGGALQMGDLRLLEDGSERGGALVSDVVATETARDGCVCSVAVREHRRACRQALIQRSKHVQRRRRTRALGSASP